MSTGEAALLGRRMGLWTIAVFAAVVALAALVSCSPQVSDENQAAKDDATPAIAVEFSMGSDCVVCHASEQASATDTACLASKHADQTTCTTCHGDESSLSKAHDGVTAEDKKPTKLKRTTVESETCLACHSETDRVAATADTTVCTDSEGTTVNPHDLPANDDHDSIACSDCHSEHTTETAVELAPQECLNCHHAGVYACYTCHD